MKKTVLIMAGGTGGHVFPALSIAEYLIEKGMNVEWLGTRSGMEARVIGNTDIPIHYISISGLRGKSMWKKVTAPFVIFIALVQAVIKMASIKPSCVLGMGGFVTGPGGVAAWLLRKPLCIHEQNAVAGFSNQMLSPFANRVMEAFPGAFERKNKMTTSRIIKGWTQVEDAIEVGNPVRADILNCPQPVQRYLKSTGKLKIFVLGGSLGAMAINKILPDFLSHYKESERPEILHQCGKNNLKQTQALYQKFGIAEGEEIRLRDFIDDMAAAYCWADLIICRSGALTVSEIANIGIPSILIPYPSAVDNHQTENARLLESVGAATILEEKYLSVQSLVKIVDKYTENRSLILEDAQAAKTRAQPESTKIAAEICLEACNA